MVVRIQNGSVLLREGAVATSSGCCCGQCLPGETQCGAECCAQTETCCNGDCCTQEQTCCSGSCCDTVCCNGVCCQPGELCIGGECVKPCTCPDFCMFQMQATGPISTPLWPPFPCELGPGLDTYVAEDDSAVVDCGVEGNFGGDPVGFVLVRPYESRMLFGKNFRVPELLNAAGIPSYAAEYEAGALIVCDLAEGRLRLFLEVYYRIRVAFIDSAVPEGAYGERHIGWRARKEMPSDCIVVQRPSCGVTEPRRVVFMNAPFEIEASLDSFSGDEILGVTDETIGNQTYVGPCADAIADSFNPSFLVVQRPSCSGVPCNCSTDLDGLKATFEGKEFTLGTEDSYNEFLSGYELVTAHYKDGSGYVFEKYKVLEFPAGTIGDVQLATVYCETDDEADPPVPRWYVRFESICRLFAPDAETKRTEIGYMQCVESAGCSGRAVGSPIPLGSAQEIEELPGSPETTNGLNACTPPARADLTIFEDCG